LCLSGLAAYTIYLGRKFGDPFAFEHAMEAWGQSPTALDWFNLIRFDYATYALVAWRYLPTLSIFLGTLLLLATPVLLVLFRKRVDPAPAFYMASMFLLFHVPAHHHADALRDVGRHISLIFPFPLLTAGAILGLPLIPAVVRKLLFYGVATVSASLYFYFTTLFFRGVWVS
jgi:hypothetical protein